MHVFTNKNKHYGGDAPRLFETRPLEDILADIADGWNNIKKKP